MKCMALVTLMGERINGYNISVGKSEEKSSPERTRSGLK
jgi:hypothetical protein